MEGYVPFSFDAQRAKLVAGYKSELVQFKSIAQWPKLTFVDATPAVVQQTMEAKTVTDSLPTIDPWGMRRK
jgi:hypothetical protein